MRRIAVLDAPSNLGLRPPTPTSVPGCAKAPGALRDHGLIDRLRARDAGCLTPGRYDPGEWRPGDGVCHAAAISAYSLALADRIGDIIDHGEFPVILGGDCSILLGSALAMHRLGAAVGGRVGLVFVDGHSDFRHPGNASYVGAAAGEDLALVTGRGQADLTAIEGRRPYFRDIDVVVLGIRAQDEYRLDLQAAGILHRPVPQLRAEGAARTAQWAHEELADCAGYWVHVDVDVLDPAVMPAVDAPDPGGIAFPELELLLAGLVDTPHCLGVEVTVFDPDYDPDGAYAAEIVDTLVAGLSPVSRPATAVGHPFRDAPSGPEEGDRSVGSAEDVRPVVSDDGGRSVASAEGDGSVREPVVPREVVTPFAPVPRTAPEAGSSPAPRSPGDTSGLAGDAPGSGDPAPVPAGGAGSAAPSAAKGSSSPGSASVAARFSDDSPGVAARSRDGAARPSADQLSRLRDASVRASEQGWMVGRTRPADVVGPPATAGPGRLRRAGDADSSADGSGRGEEPTEPPSALGIA